MIAICSYFFPFTKTSATRAKEVFAWIEEFAKSPVREIFGRYVWNSPQATYFIGVESLLTTQCRYTGEGLKTALFGIDRNLKTFDNQKESWSAFMQTIENNRYTTTAYCFVMKQAPIVFSDKPSRLFGGHHFLVIQYHNEKDETRYRFYQSNVVDYTLEQYIERGPLELGHREFLYFIKELEQEEWTEEYGAFCSKYFGINKPKNIDGMMSIPISVEWDACSAEKILKNKEEFEIERARRDFPKIFLTSVEKIKSLEELEEQGDLVKAVLLGTHGIREKMLGVKMIKFITT